MIADKLKKLGFWITAIRPPTVLLNTARQRITLTTNHEIADLQQLIAAISKVCDES